MNKSLASSSRTTEFIHRAKLHNLSRLSNIIPTVLGQVLMKMKEPKKKIIKKNIWLNSAENPRVSRRSNSTKSAQAGRLAFLFSVASPYLMMHFLCIWDLYSCWQIISLYFASQCGVAVGVSRSISLTFFFYVVVAHFLAFLLVPAFYIIYRRKSGIIKKL